MNDILCKYRENILGVISNSLYGPAVHLGTHVLLFPSVISVAVDKDTIKYEKRFSKKHTK